MKKLLLPILITSALAVTACCDKAKKATAEQSATAESSTASSAKLAGLAGLFAVPALADIAGLEGGSKVGEGKFSYFNGEKVETVDAEVYKFVHPAEGAEGEFSQDEFNAQITEQMKKLGAKEITNDVLSAEVAKELASKEGTHDSTYLGEEVDFSKTTLRQFAVEKDGQTIIYQVFSDDKHGEVGVVVVGGADEGADQSASEEPTTEEAPAEEPKKVTSTDIKKDLDELKKAVVNINFDSSKATVQSSDQYVIDELYKLLSENADLKLTIEGHTDNTGNPASNKALSLARANTVKASLVAKGIDGSRLKTAGVGADKPIADNNTEEGKKKNRRVELVEF